MIQAIDCLTVREQMLNEAKLMAKECLDNNVTPKLVVIQVGDNPASSTYVKNKIKTCDEVGITSEHIKLDGNIDATELMKMIDAVNDDDTVHGILLQLPLPEHLAKNEQMFIDRISWNKDVDGLTTENQARLWSGNMKRINPCTAEGILRLLKDDLSGKTITIAGRSKLVGMPLFKLLLDRNATVTMCHSKTDDVGYHAMFSDVFISAIGKPKYFKSDDCAGSAIIDVGINRDENGKLCGDVDWDSFTQECVDTLCTPVPKGVGVLTTAQLMLNTLKCIKYQKKF